MAKGSCLCGKVSFELDPAGVVLAVGCYCINCRKVSGSQFGVYLQVRPDSFRFLSGEDNVGSYESSPGNRRGFCKSCGCVAPIQTGYGVIRVPGGALDDDPGLAPEANLFAERKAEWCTTERAKHNFPDAGTPAFWQSALLRFNRP